MATVVLDPMLAEYVPKRRLTSSAPSVAELLGELEERYPALRFRIRDEHGSVRRFVRIFVNGRELGSLQGSATALGPGDTVDVLHSIQGG